ncbi:MAG: YicC family protein [Cyclobacteriaceae bacterium]|nr:YicC family protein [Cyclobacteriaceae bacterium]
MNKSMTGYGQARYEDDQYCISVEIKTLNSKFLDVGLRIPKAFADKEIVVRNLISEQLERGKVSLMLEYTNKIDDTAKININEKLFKAYYDKLKALSDSVNANSEDVFRMAVQFPEVIETIDDNSNREREWELIWPVLKNALDNCNAFRAQEGAVLSENLKHYITSIKENLVKIIELDPKRIERIRNRLQGNLNEFIHKEDIDENRLEQELIYYIEKLDISEEKVRLTSHLNYFMEILSSNDSMGKKMNFMTQEIGREINTIGSKSNDAEMQKLVVNMKEELEKVKEQILNLL